MKIRKPCALNEIGKRANQEDSIFPSKGMADESSRLFLVCDGMGGHENGEVASRLVCDTFASVLQGVDDELIDTDKFKQALSAAYDALDREDPDPMSTRKMGTTLTFLHLADSKVVVAHMGDSRVYHIRPNSDNPIVYRTNDHSLVNELVRAELITPEEALTHPRRNVITRAMQPNLERRHEADVREFFDVLPGDYFFMCSDGILESLRDDVLIEILRRDDTDDQKMEAIRQLCEESSNDNFSAYLVPIEEGIAYDPSMGVSIAEVSQVDAVELAEVPEVEHPEPEYEVNSIEEKSGVVTIKKNTLGIIAIGVLAAVAVGGFMLLRPDGGEQPANQTVKEVVGVQNTDEGNATDNNSTSNTPSDSENQNNQVGQATQYGTGAQNQDGENAATKVDDKKGDALNQQLQNVGGSKAPVQGSQTPTHDVQQAQQTTLQETPNPAEGETKVADNTVPNTTTASLEGNPTAADGGESSAVTPTTDEKGVEEGVEVSTSVSTPEDTSGQINETHPDLETVSTEGKDGDKQIV